MQMMKFTLAALALSAVVGTSYADVICKSENEGQVFREAVIFLKYGVRCDYGPGQNVYQSYQLFGNYVQNGGPWVQPNPYLSPTTFICRGSSEDCFFKLLPP
jgi:hypothetical protein